MNQPNNFFMTMCKEAMNELASGEKGWREAETNTLILACFGMLANHLTGHLAKPLWFFASTILAGIIGFFIMRILGG